MKLVVRESTGIDAAPEAVWRVLADPSRRGEWNDKIVRVERRRSGEPVVGERYTLRYRLSGRENELEAEILACDPPRSLVVRERWPREPDPDRAVVLTWRLEPTSDGTRATQEVDVSHAPMPAPVKLLMWVMSRIGTPRGPTVMETLRELVLTEPPDR